MSMIDHPDQLTFPDFAEREFEIEASFQAKDQSQVKQNVVDVETIESRLHDQQICRFKMRFGNADIDLEGPASLVVKNFQAFVELVNRFGDSVIVGNGTASKEESVFSGPAALPHEVSAAPCINDPLFSRIYLKGEDKVSLIVMPDTEHPNSDCLLLLIYGFQKLLNINEGVQSTSLMDAAKQSGLRIDRIDRSITTDHNRLILKGGSGKGSRYSLNNRGILYVEQLIRTMFE